MSWQSKSRLIHKSKVIETYETSDEKRTYGMLSFYDKRRPSKYLLNMTPWTHSTVVTKISHTI